MLIDKIHIVVAKGGHFSGNYEGISRVRTLDPALNIWSQWGQIGMVHRVILFTKLAAWLSNQSKQIMRKLFWMCHLENIQ